MPKNDHVINYFYIQLGYTMEIKKATIKNVEAICDIGKNSFLASHGISAPKKDIDSFLLEAYSLPSVTKELNNPEHNYHLLFQNSNPLGFSNLQVNCKNSNLPYGNTAKLDRIYFLEEAYGKGFGAQLLQFNIEFSIKNNQTGMWLFTWIENQRAISFYQKFGFKIIGKHDYKISETHSNPNHIMFLEH